MPGNFVIKDEDFYFSIAENQPLFNNSVFDWASSMSLNLSESMNTVNYSVNLDLQRNLFQVSCQVGVENLLNNGLDIEVSPYVRQLIILSFICFLDWSLWLVISFVSFWIFKDLISDDISVREVFAHYMRFCVKRAVKDDYMFLEFQQYVF